MVDRLTKLPANILTPRGEGRNSLSRRGTPPPNETLLLSCSHACTSHFRYFIRPRFIRDTSTVDMSTTLLGSKVDSPICVAPTGAQCYLHWEGELGTARGK
jgi:isopentenyl diphosphate isomerase/L-lactate dehydrogenase-like FMN-dependent dehydrogenase